MLNADISRIIRSNEIQSAIQPRRPRRQFEKKRNPLRHPEVMADLNPLFSQQWEEIKEYRPDAVPNTEKILKPLRKKQKVSLKLTKDEQLSHCHCFVIIFGYILFV